MPTPAPPTSAASVAYAQSRPVDVAHAHGFNLNEDWTALPVPDLLVDAKPGDALEVVRIAVPRSTLSSNVDFQVLAVDPGGNIRRHLGDATGLSALAMTKTDANRSASALVTVQLDDVADGPLRLRLAARARGGAGALLDVDNPALEWWCRNVGPVAAPAPPLVTATVPRQEDRLTATATGKDMTVGGEQMPRRINGHAAPLELRVPASEGQTIEVSVTASAERLSGYRINLDVWVLDSAHRERRALSGATNDANLWRLPSGTTEQHTFSAEFVVRPSDSIDGIVPLCLVAGNPLGTRRLHIETAPLTFSARVMDNP